MYIGFGSFLLMPPLLLSVLYFKRIRLHFLLVLFFISGCGWLSVNAGNYYFGQHMCEMAQASTDGSRYERACVVDGARDVFTFLFGWLYSLIYSIPFLLLYAASVYVRRKREVKYVAT